MTARMELVAALEAVLVGVDVEPYASERERPVRPLVMVAVNTVQPVPQARLTHRAYTFQLILLGPSEDTEGPGDDLLDAALEQVLNALDEGSAMEALPRWTEARRATYMERIPAYEVDVTAMDVKAPQPDPDPAP